MHYGGKLQSSLGSFQYLTIGLGAVLGIAWAIMLGTWLEAAAPLGAAAGFMIGGAGIVLIAACYAELATAFPKTGGDVIYVLEVFGPKPAFVVGWFLVLMAVTVTSFEAISLAWFLETLFPDVFRGAPVFTVNGMKISVYSILIEIAGILWIAAANYRGARSFSRIQDTFTVLKIIGAISFIIAALVGGAAANITPPLTPSGGKSLLGGIGWIVITAPIWFGGFQVIPQAIEERRAGTSLNRIGWMTVLAVVIGVLFYSLIVLSASLIVPWQSLTGAQLPAVAAINAAFHGGMVAKVVLIAVVLGIVAAWNSCFLWATHLLMGMSRSGLLTPALARTNRFGSPGMATLLVGGVGLAGLVLGREGLVSIINMAAMSLAISFAACCAATLKLRRDRPEIERPFRVPGGRLTMMAATSIAGLMATAAVLEPLSGGGVFPMEWRLTLLWGVIGMLAWQGFAGREAAARTGE